MTWSAEDAKKGGFEHFMLKEIYEVPEAVQEYPHWATSSGRGVRARLQGRFVGRMVACGTSYHAAMVGSISWRRVSKLPVSSELASEYRYS